MLWDQGTWTPESEDVDAALKKGDLKFTLDGYKLKGSWVLVRTGGRWGGGDGRSWLLIKHKDDWAGDVDIAEFAPRSVKSEGDFEDILAADKPDVWHSNRPAETGDTAQNVRPHHQAGARDARCRGTRGETVTAPSREKAARKKKQQTVATSTDCLLPTAYRPQPRPPPVRLGRPGPRPRQPDARRQGLRL